MADDDESDEPAVVLGDSVEVEGVPLAQVSARLMWGTEKSAIDEREGETSIRTPDGPRKLTDVLGDVDQTYFPTRQEFEAAIRRAIGHGPVPTPDEETGTADDTESESDESGDEPDEQREESGDSEESDETDDDETDGEDDEETAEDAEEGDDEGTAEEEEEGDDEEIAEEDEQRDDENSAEDDE